jgi:DNA gyrase subunit A
MEDAAKKFGDARRTRLVGEREASAIEFNPEEFVEHEDVTVILSKQGWIRRIKAELADASSLKFREGDGLFGWARVNTERTVALFSNLGKMYILRALDIPATSGFGEPVGSLFSLADGEFMVGFVVPDAVRDLKTKGECLPAEDWNDAETEESDELQPTLFDELEDKAPVQGASDHAPAGGILVTRHGKGFRFDYRVLGETTKRSGRRLVNLGSGDEVATVQPVVGENVVIVADSGHVLVFPGDQVPLLVGAAGGVRMIKLQEGSRVVAMETLGRDDSLRIQPSSGEEKVVSLGEIPLANRGGKGKRVGRGILQMGRIAPDSVPPASSPPCK